MMFSKNRALRGIDEICLFLQCREYVTILQAKISEGLPILKKGGIWCGMSEDLLRWKRRLQRTHVLPHAHPIMVVKRPKPYVPPRRWGLDGVLKALLRLS